MYNIKIKDEFSSAHNLREYEGKCENLHGHNWKVEIELSKEKLDNVGMVLDFKKMKKILSKALEELDHKYLNDLPYFKEHNPTSENIAKYLYDVLSRDISDLKRVTVWESDFTSATFSEE